MYNEWEEYDAAKIKEFFDSEIAKHSKELTFTAPSTEDFAKLVEVDFQAV